MSDIELTTVELTTKQSNKVKRAMKALDDVWEEVAKENPDLPELHWYVEAEGSLNLMSEYSNDMKYGGGYDHIIENWNFRHLDCGGW